MLRISLKFLLAAILILFSYSAFIVFQAKSYTENVILEDYSNGKWRLFNSSQLDIFPITKYLTDKQLDDLILIQDPNFKHHNGIDLSTPGAGLTTITQSLVKKFYFENFKPGFAKYKQSIIAIFVVDYYLTKTEQLELFVNSAYMGDTKNKAIFGLFSASEDYYNKSIDQLTYDEYLSLIAMLIAPNTFNISTEPENNKLRVERIKKVLSGEYQPKKLTDLYYDQ